jgi:acetyltransferase
MLETIRQSGRTLLTEFESKQLLAAYGFPTVETQVARSEAEAVTCAEDIGYPVVLKLSSETITHKTDVGGVQLRLSGADQVRSAYHAIEGAVSNTAGPEHFQGVTVPSMATN